MPPTTLFRDRLRRFGGGSYCIGTYSRPGGAGELCECGDSFEEAIELFRLRHPQMVIEPE